jgi:hypothetical protein
MCTLLVSTQELLPSHGSRSRPGVGLEPQGISSSLLMPRLVTIPPIIIVNDTANPTPQLASVYSLPLTNGDIDPHRDNFHGFGLYNIPP